MKLFWRNIFRMSMKNKFSILGAVMIIALAITCFIAMSNSATSMTENAQLLYDDSNAADVYAYVAGIPASDINQLYDVEGIELVSGRLSVDMRVKLEDKSKNLVLYVCGYNPETPMDKFIMSCDPPSKNEIILGKKLIEKYGYEVGDTITLMYGGSTADFTFIGKAQTPTTLELLLPNVFVSDAENYDMALIDENRLGELTGNTGLYTMISIKLYPGYTFEDVQLNLRDKLNPYGLYSLTSQADEASISSANDMIAAIAAVSYLVPLILLSVAVFMLYAVLKKLISGERTLIGTMKAFGLDDRELVSGYLIQGFVIGFIGALIGAVLSYPVGKMAYFNTADYYSFPVNEYHHYPVTIVIGFLISCSTGVLASYLGVKEILKIVPSQAMKSPMPPSGGIKITLPKKIHEKVGLLGKMAVQSVTRNPINGMMIVLAIVVAVGVGGGVIMAMDMVGNLPNNLFDNSQKYDYKINLTQEVTPEELREATQYMELVENADNANGTSVVGYNAGSIEEFNIMITDSDNDSVRILDRTGKEYKLDDTGIILSTVIADKLDVKAGDKLDLVFPFISPNKVSVPVAQLVEFTLGNSAYNYISYDCLENILGTRVGSNLLFLTTKDGEKNELQNRLREGKNITRITDKEHEKVMFIENAATYTAICVIIGLMAFIAGGIMIYHLSMINLRERTLEFGTMLILGRSEKSLKYMLAFENFLYLLGGSIISIPMSWFFLNADNAVFESSGLYGHVVWRPDLYLLTVAFCTVIFIITYLKELKLINSIELTEILKERG